MRLQKLYSIHTNQILLLVQHSQVTLFNGILEQKLLQSNRVFLQKTDTIIQYSRLQSLVPKMLTILYLSQTIAKCASGTWESLAIQRSASTFLDSSRHNKMIKRSFRLTLWNFRKMRQINSMSAQKTTIFIKQIYINLVPQEAAKFSKILSELFLVTVLQLLKLLFILKLNQELVIQRAKLLPTLQICPN